VLRAAGSLFFWAAIVVTSAALFPVAVLIALVTAPFDRRRRLLHLFTCFWASLYSWLNPAWRVYVVGREHVRPDIAYVMVANHLSFLDILVLFRLFRHFRWVSKLENFRIPLVGWVMRMNRYIELERGKADSVRRMLRTCEKSLAERSSVLIFPEGTRSETGELRPFKVGAFELARSSRCPILPVAVDGTARALPKRGIVLQGRCAIRVQVLDEIPPDDFKDLSSAELAARVRQQIAAALEG
jgi:1-acyl-sn-glycerol-3-phosphate acyltransferase